MILLKQLPLFFPSFSIIVSVIALTMTRRQANKLLQNYSISRNSFELAIVPNRRSDDQISYTLPVIQISWRNPTKLAAHKSKCFNTCYQSRKASGMDGIPQSLGAN